ncbi:MAG: phosphatase PAP2 family protein [Acidimicrobiales bacterium]
MTTAAERTTSPSLRWWREVLYILGFYGIYTVVRDTQGSAGRGFTAKGSVTAFHHAQGIIRIERDLWLYQEQRIQGLFDGASRFFQFWNVFYGTAHFVVTAAAIIWLFNRQPERYPYWRNVLAICTGLALVGFALFPLMPPRLLDAAQILHPSVHYGFVDTLERYGGPWSFDSGAMSKISNQFAAMPSLHFAWSSFCLFAFWPACKRWWTRALVVLYPLVTLFAIVVTANHFVLDAVGGAAVLGAALLLARPVTRWTNA